MNSRDLILAVLSADYNKDYFFSPVKVQKLFFLVDKKIVNELKIDPLFNFQPYHYGPFDVQVYKELNLLNLQGLVDVNLDGSYLKYKLSDKGYQAGSEILKTLPIKTMQYLTTLVGFIKSQSFMQLVSSIYEEFPEMKSNSIFNK